MKGRKVALAVILSMVLTSVQANALIGHAEEDVFWEDVVMDEDADCGAVEEHEETESANGESEVFVPEDDFVMDMEIVESTADSVGLMSGGSSTAIPTIEAGVTSANVEAGTVYIAKRAQAGRLIIEKSPDQSDMQVTLEAYDMEMDEASSKERVSQTLEDGSLVYKTSASTFYRLTISNIEGSVPIAFSSLHDYVGPTITIDRGETATLTVKTYEGESNLSYQWYIVNANLTETKLEGCEEPSYELTNAEETTTYSCHITDDRGIQVTQKYFVIVNTEEVECDHEMVVISRVEPTCVSDGYATMQCTKCDYTYDEILPATGKHTYGAYTVTSQATVLTAGTETRTCTGCGYTESRATAMLTPTITINVTKIPLKVKQSTTKVKVSGLAAGDYVVSWTSSNTKVAKVNAKTGKITAQNKEGKADITITLASGLKKTVQVTVQKKAVATTKISGLSKKLTLEKGKKTTLVPVIAPVTSTDKITYKTSNKKVATVNAKGVVTAKASGTAKITVTSGKKKFVVTVTVPKTAPTGITGVKSAITLKKGKSATLKPKLSPKGAEAKITYKSSNKKVATVDSKGKIAAKKKGTAVITVTAGKVKKTCKVTVK